MDKLKDGYMYIKTQAIFSLSLREEADAYYKSELSKQSNNTTISIIEEGNNIIITTKSGIRYNGVNERIENARKHSNEYRRKYYKKRKLMVLENANQNK